ncbi:MAG: YggS family pyridoxal phosphate-dependent enzyme [Candidatus Dadabacteria bacterium]|nr:YggS family pyridoxal phosphate-dependent enzyme [Candidatus Dadabacteria bacterium]
MNIAENLKSVKERIEKAAFKAQKSASEIKLVAVSKGVEAERVIEAVSCGIITFGENYAQEFRDKYNAVEKATSREIEWHFIGRLQRNKMKYILDKVRLIHSLDSASVAEEINKRAEKIGTKVPLLVELNADEEVKGGVKVEELDGFLLDLLRFPKIDVKGLMIMPPLFDNPEMTRPYFRNARELRDRFQSKFPSLRELSMGMSGDFEVAIEEGATIVRIGTAIFGPRSE